MDPLQTAASCLGNVEITISPGGRSKPDVDHAWTLNGMAGASLGHGFLFDARMTYRIVREADPARGPWRVKTVAYGYRFAALGQDVFRLHWHPQGRSPITYPHLHLALDAGDMSSSQAIKRHLPSGRAMFEDAITWAIEMGAPTARPDWETVLRDCQAAHLQHRSWK